MHDQKISHSSDWQFRLNKSNQAKELIAACFDLLNDEITGPQWLGKLGGLANCRNVSCYWWRAGHPETVLKDVHGADMGLSEAWLKRLDQAVAAANPQEPCLMDEIAPAALRLLDSPDEPLFSARRLVACLDWHPARVFIVLDNRIDLPEWQAYDRERFRELLPILRKSIGVKKRLSRLLDIMDLTNNIFDQIPCGIISLLPDGKIQTINNVARLMIKGHSLFNETNRYFHITDPALQSELESELAHIESLTEDQINSYVWYKSMGGSPMLGGLMVTLKAFILDSWRRESTSHDRLALMFIEQQGLRAVPGANQLAEFYGLTGAQARMLNAILQQVSIEEAAGMLNISVNTARSHLRAIYSRVGVENKNQLIQLVSAVMAGQK